MKTFQYKVITPDHLVKVGVLESSDLSEARQSLINNDWTIIDVTEKIDWKAALAKITGSPLKLSSLSTFCYNMAVIIETGVNLVKGINTQLEQTKDKKMKHLLIGLVQELERGSLLSTAMKKNEAYFPLLLTQMVASGELSGNLDEVFYNMAEYYERENTIREKIRSASVYPMILGFIAVSLLVFFITFILPTMTDLVTQNGGSSAKLPAITRAVINVSSILTHYFYVIVPVLMGVLGAALYYSRLDPTKGWLDLFVLKLPLFGLHIRNLITARFTSTFGMYLRSGVPISSGLNSLEEMIGNQAAKTVFKKASERVLRGESLTNALQDENFFDGMVIEMMRVGEEAGNLEEMLQKLSKQYDKKVTQGIDKMVSMIEPVFTLVIGIFIAILVVAIAMPMLNMSNLINVNGGS